MSGIKWGESLPEENDDIAEGLQGAIGDLDKLEVEINEMRRKGSYPGNPGDNIPIG
jgi:hypothetical protein